MKNKIVTQFDEHVHYYTNPGTREVPTYAQFTDEEGVVDLKQTGVVNLYDEIQSHAESVDINVILSKFANGDTSVLNKKVGIFTDLTQLPKSYAELYQKVLDGEQYFNKLPVDIKQQFNNSASEFFASIGTPKFNAIFNKAETEAKESIVDVVEKETSDNEH